MQDPPNADDDGNANLFRCLRCRNIRLAPQKNTKVKKTISLIKRSRHTHPLFSPRPFLNQNRNNLRYTFLYQQHKKSTKKSNNKKSANLDRRRRPRKVSSATQRKRLSTNLFERSVPQPIDGIRKLRNRSIQLPDDDDDDVDGTPQENYKIIMDDQSNQLKSSAKAAAASAVVPYKSVGSMGGPMFSCISSLTLLSPSEPPPSPPPTPFDYKVKLWRCICPDPFPPPYPLIFDRYNQFNDAVLLFPELRIYNGQLTTTVSAAAAAAAEAAIESASSDTSSEYMKLHITSSSSSSSSEDDTSSSYNFDSVIDTSTECYITSSSDQTMDVTTSSTPDDASFNKNLNTDLCVDETNVVEPSPADYNFEAIDDCCNTSDFDDNSVTDDENESSLMLIEPPPDVVADEAEEEEEDDKKNIVLLPSTPNRLSLLSAPVTGFVQPHLSPSPSDLFLQKEFKLEHLICVATAATTTPIRCANTSTMSSMTRPPGVRKLLPNILGTLFFYLFFYLNIWLHRAQAF